MPIDSDSPFAVDHDGFSVEKADGSKGVWFGGGNAIPTHEAIIGSFYGRSNGDWFKQEGPGLTDWAVFDGSGGTAAFASAIADHVASPIAYDLDAGVWTKFTDFTDQIESTRIIVDLPNDKIVVGSGGDGPLLINYSLNATYNTAGLFCVAIYLNGVREEASIARGDFSNGQNDHVSGTYALSVVEDDFLEIFIRSSAGGQDPDIDSVIFSVDRPSGGATGAVGPQGPAGQTNVDGGDASTVFAAGNIDGGTA